MADELIENTLRKALTDLAQEESRFCDSRLTVGAKGGWLLGSIVVTVDGHAYRVAIERAGRDDEFISASASRAYIREEVPHAPARPAPARRRRVRR